MITTDRDIVEATVRSLLGSSQGPPKYLYRKMVKGLVADIAKRKFNDETLRSEDKILDNITEQVMEAIDSSGVYQVRERTIR